MEVDDEGYLWIGTRRGLNRFNGSNYRVYYQSDTLSLRNDFISALCRDSDGRMWIGTSTGVELLNDGNVDKSVDISCGPVFCMSQFDEDNLLILSGNSLCLLDKKSFEMTPVWQDDSSVRSRFTVTKDSVVWIYDSHNPVIHILDSQFTLIDMITLSGKGVKFDSHDIVNAEELLQTDILKPFPYSKSFGITLLHACKSGTRLVI
jgi:hypothetical protein